MKGSEQATANNAATLHKVILIGAPGSGKTSFLKRLTQDMFDVNERETTALEFGSKALSYGDIKVIFQIWDTGGALITSQTTPVKNYYNDTAIFALFIDLSEPDLANPDFESQSIRYLRERIDFSQYFKKQNGITPCCFVILSKADMASTLPSNKTCQMIAERAMAAAHVPKSAQWSYLITSATRRNIEEAATGWLDALYPVSLTIFLEKKTKWSPSTMINLFRSNSTTNRAKIEKIEIGESDKEDYGVDFPTFDST